MAIMKQKHPKGLYVLFFTEMWERFGFYTLLAILALYMDEYFHMPKTFSGQVYGGFIALVYFTPLFGGYLADKFLGFKKSIIIGAILMSCGYGLLAIPDSRLFFFLALIVIVIGNGFFKPNISTLVGNLYDNESPLKDLGYSIFYMGINIGAFFAPLVASELRTRLTWHAAFAAAAFGMLVSLVIFILFKKHLHEVDEQESENSASTSESTKVDDKERIFALLTVYGIVAVFWMAFHQNGFTLTFWARDATNTTIAPEKFQMANPFFIVSMTPLLVLFWKWLNKKKREPSTPAKIGIGMILTAVAFTIMAIAGYSGGNTGKVSPVWLVSAYWWITMGEICLSPMGLSYASKIAPKKLKGLMMGGWFAATALGNYMSGFLGSFWEKMPHSQFFWMLSITSVVAAVVLKLFLKRLNRVGNV